jgi:hypothetical protein
MKTYINIEKHNMPDYQNGKIYKIVSFQTDKVYIGSTCQGLAVRKAGHVRNYKSYLNGKGHNRSSFEIVRHDDADIILIENYPCNSKNELCARERYYIENTKNCTNKYIPNRTKAEWKRDNHEKVVEQRKEYYALNKDRIKEKVNEYNQINVDKKLEYQKAYKERNKERIKEKRKEYRDKNKEKIIQYARQYKELLREKKKETFVCECGAEITVHHKARHLKTNKHIKATKPQ